MKPIMRSLLQKLLLFLSFLLSLTLCVLVIYRYQLVNRFSLLFGDRYDAVIVASVLEHWSNVFLGMSSWTKLACFFPHENTIAHSDAYFLLGIFYHFFRLCGLDYFISIEAVGMVLKAIGFLGEYLFMRRVFAFSHGWSLLAAVLFTLNNAMTNHGQRIQLATVAFAPVIALVLYRVFDSFEKNHLKSFYPYMAFLSLLYGALCMTCFYMAWFFAYFSVFFFGFYLCLIGKKNRTLVFLRVRERWLALLVVSSIFFLALAPFVLTYYPKSLEVGVRSYDDSVRGKTVPLPGVIQVGRANLLFGRVYNDILELFYEAENIAAWEYYNTGMSPFLFYIFLCSSVMVFYERDEAFENKILKSFLLATIVTWLSTLSINGHSLWYLVYHLFPGAKALNVVAGYQIFLAFPVVVVSVYFLKTVALNKYLLVGVCLILILGELNVPYLALNRQNELERISSIPPPPKDCEVFFVSAWGEEEMLGGEWIYQNYAHNVSAMLLGEILRIPTINGFASFNPPDWNFAYPSREDYDDRVIAYCREHDIRGLFLLDLNSKKWVDYRDVLEQD